MHAEILPFVSSRMRCTATFSCLQGFKCWPVDIGSVPYTSLVPSKAKSTFCHHHKLMKGGGLAMQQGFLAVFAITHIWMSRRTLLHSAACVAPCKAPHDGPLPRIASVNTWQAKLVSWNTRAAARVPRVAHEHPPGALRDSSLWQHPATRLSGHSQARHPQHPPQPAAQAPWSGPSPEGHPGGSPSFRGIKIQGNEHYEAKRGYGSLRADYRTDLRG